MLSIRACSAPDHNVVKIVLPKRLTPIRSPIKPKRIETFKKLQESIKKNEIDLIKELLMKDWPVDEDDF
jgi:hypothetical protein